MTSAQLSIETAPRDLEKLKNIGRFNMRGLATLLGVFKTEENKTSFMQLSNEQQAAEIFKLLQENDGGGKAAAKGTSGRAPSTKNAGKGAATGGTTTPAKTETPATGATQGNGAGSVSGAGAEKVLTAINALKESYDSLQETIESLTARVGVLEGISSGTNRFVALSIGLNLKLAEQVLGASPDQVLEVVLEDMPIVEKAMARMAPADAEDEADDEEDEGNEE